MILLKYCFVIVFVFCSWNLFGQVTRQDLQESQIPLDLQTYFFGEFNDAKGVKWTYIKLDDKKMYEATFSVSDSLKSGVFDRNGTLIQEYSIVKKPKLPSGMKFHVDLNYAKFKSQSLERYKVYGSKEAIYYRLEGTSKQGVIVLWFDISNNIIEQSELPLLIEPKL